MDRMQLSHPHMTIVAAATILLVVTAVASFIPAHRAASLNLVKALHYE